MFPKLVRRGGLGNRENNQKLFTHCSPPALFAVPLFCLAGSSQENCIGSQGGTSVQIFTQRREDAKVLFCLLKIK